MTSIRISEKHGVNPSLSQCFFCMGDKNELMLLGRLPGDVEAPRKAVYNHEPCDQCAKMMTMGVILISARDGEQGNNPYRTGGWVVVKDEFITRNVTPPEHAERILKARMAFLPDAVWDALGLPRTEAETEQLGGRVLKPGESL